QDVEGRPRGRRSPEQGELVRRPFEPAPQSLVDAARVGFEHLSDFGTNGLELHLRRAPEAETTAHLIDGQTLGPDELGERPRTHAEQQLELEGTVLGMAEAKPEPGVAGALRVDMGDSPTIAPDGERPLQASRPDPAAHPRQPATQEAEEDAGPRDTGHVRPSLR